MTPEMARERREQMGFDDFTSSKQLLILTKEPYAPALYWHQDWGQWNDPLSCTPWPQKIFLSYYLEDTSLENGCFQVIPGTHLKRIPLHDQLVTAHEQGARFIEESHPIMFSHHPDQVDVLTKAGSLVLGDARVLHAAEKTRPISVGICFYYGIAGRRPFLTIGRGKLHGCL